jgi:addiction module RelE/StbE family toxin
VFTVVWAPNAVREVSRIHDYIAAFNPRAAARLAAQLYEAGASLAEHAERGRPVPATALRELAIVNPYIIRYRVKGNVVRILRVRHGAQQ